MAQSSFSIFYLTEDQAIDLLLTSPEQLEDPTDRYIAASRLVDYPSERAIQALLKVVQDKVTGLDGRIVRRKSVETLGYLKASDALPVIRACLQDEDRYTVENAVWAIGEIGTQDPFILDEITQLLDLPDQNYRKVIQTLAKLLYCPALDRIRQFISSEYEAISGAARSAVYLLTGDIEVMAPVVKMLQHPNVTVRRTALQDLIDARYRAAMPQVAQCPTSMVFRLRAIRLLAKDDIARRDISFDVLQPYLDQVMVDHPDDIEMVHEYDQTPTLEFAINELYEADFGRCYLATQTLLEIYRDGLPDALMTAYADKAHHDYGGHYHVIKLFGWLDYQPAYELLCKALHNEEPQFKKSRIAGAIALGRLGNPGAIPELLVALKSDLWELRYAALMALDQLGAMDQVVLEKEEDFLVKAKADRILKG